MKDYKKILENLIDIVSRENASDLHLSPNRKPFIRVDSQLIALENQDELTKEDMFNIVKSIVSEEKLEKIMNAEEIDFAYSYNDKIRLRSTAYIQSGGINLAFRVIQEIRELDTLNLPDVLGKFARKEIGRAHV